MLSTLKVGRGKKNLFHGKTNSVFQKRLTSDHIYKFLVYSLYFLADLFLNLLWFYPAIFSHGNSVIGLCGPGQECDLVQFVWGEKWTAYSLMHFINPLFSNFINAPAGANAMWNSWSTPSGIIMAPFERIFSPITVYNLTVLFSATLNCFSMTLLVKKISDNYFIGFLGGIIWGFSPYFAFHYQGHLNLTQAFLIPIIALIILDAVIYKKRSLAKNSIYLGMLFTLQAFLSEELLMDLAIAGLASAVVALVIYRHKILKEQIISLIKLPLLAAVIFLILFSYPLYFQFLGPQAIQGTLHPEQSANFYQAIMLHPFTTLFDYPFKKIENVSLLTDPLAEPYPTIGLPIMLFSLIISFVFIKERVFRFLSLVMLFTFILSLGPEFVLQSKEIFPLPWILIDKIPPLNNLIALRINLFVYFFFAIMVSLGLKFLVKKVFKLSFYGLFLFLSLMTIFPQLPYLTTTIYQPPIFFNHKELSSKVRPGATVLFIPYPRDTANAALAQIWQADANMSFKMVGGYVLAPGPNKKVEPPGGWPPTGLILQTEQIEHLTNLLGNNLQLQPPKLAANSDLAWLRSNHINYIIVGPTPYETEEISYISQILKEQPTSVAQLVIFPVAP